MVLLWIMPLLIIWRLVSLGSIWLTTARDGGGFDIVYIYGIPVGAPSYILYKLPLFFYRLRVHALGTVILLRTVWWHAGLVLLLFFYDIMPLLIIWRLVSLGIIWWTTAGGDGSFNIVNIYGTSDGAPSYILYKLPLFFTICACPPLVPSYNCLLYDSCRAWFVHGLLKDLCRFSSYGV